MKKTIGRDLPNGDYVEINVRIPNDDDERYFAVSGLGWEKRGTWSGRAAARNGREAVFAGQCVDEMRQGAPELEPLLTVHLADTNGTPMHARANGWYFYSGAHEAWEREHYGQAYVDTPRERAARSLHIGVHLLPEGMDQGQFESFCDNLARDAWPTQAHRAREAFDALNDGEGVR